MADGPGIAGQMGDVKQDFGVLVRNRNFMRLFWGQLISCTGDWIATFALMSLVYRITGSSLAVGGVLGFRIVPALFSGPFAAVIADRVDRRKLMVCCDVARGFIILMAPFVTKVWGLYVLVFFMEGLAIVWLAARDASIPNLVEPDQLTMANSMSMATTYGVIPFAALLFSLVTVPSPLTRLFITGGFFSSHPTAIAFIVDSASFFFAIYFFLRMRLESPRDHLGEDEASAGFIESITFAMKNPFSRSLLLGAAMGCIGGGSLYAVGIGYVKQVLGARSDAAFGFLMTLFGVGMIVGIVLLQVLVKHEEKPWMLRIALLVAGGIMVSMSIVHVLPLVYLLATFFGASFGVLFLVVVTMIQEGIDDKDRGKAFAAFHAVSRIFLVLGAALAGTIAGLVGTKTIHIFGFTYTVHGVSIALMVAGVLIAAVSVVPLGQKKERYREYFVRDKNAQTVEIE
ncbi:MAG: MFS transporter [Candidatus Geothermincolia bacterium]